MNHSKNAAHIFSILKALLVTFLWSTSFIIIKWGLTEIPPLSYAGLRYMLAFLCFLPFVARGKYSSELKRLTKNDYKNLALLGLVFYAFTQGAQFVGLWLLPSVTVSLMLNFTPLIVAAAGYFMLNEKPSLRQGFGILVFIAGIIVYFTPFNSKASNVLGLLVMAFGVIANSLSAVLGRKINRGQNISPLTVTFVSMGIGALTLMIAGFILNGIPEISLKSLLYLIWLASVNTALAFTIWNSTLRELSAVESSVINSAMLIQIAFLAWLFLGESITFQKGIGMFIAFTGTILVQIRKNKA
jgi:drug/metabolite transporter (DMT)-like permease